MQSHLGKSGVWRSWLAHLVWDQRVLCSSHSTPTKEIKVFDFGLFFMSAHLRAGAVSRTEDASGAAGGCFWHGTPLKMRRVPQKPVFGTEYLFRTVEACFEHRVPLKMRRVPQEAVHSLWSRLFCGPLKMRRVPQKPVFGTDYLFRTVEACFEHRVPLKMRRVPQEAFLSTARIFGTVKVCFWYRVLSHTF